MFKTVFLRNAISLLGAVLITNMAAAGEIEHPVALDALPSTGLIVLGAKGTVYQLRGSSGTYSASGSFRLPVNESPVDLTLAQINQKFYIFVTSNLTTGLGNTGRVTQYNLDGHFVQYWSVRGVCAGIDYDGNSHTLYLANSSESEILSIHFNSDGSSKVTSLGAISHVAQIGPLAFDAAGNKIYLGDIASGGIYVFDLSTKKSTTLGPRVGNVAALRIGPSGRRLLAADSQHKQIAIIDIDSKAQSTVWQTGARLRFPSGLAFVDSGLLAVSDYDLGVIYFISQDGKVVGEFR
jgi:DNA-binding beta-propeller fold protein YncE